MTKMARSSMAIAIIMFFLVFTDATATVKKDSSNQNGAIANIITINGTSTVRDWTCQGEINVATEPSVSAEPVPGFPTGVQRFIGAVFVKKIDCSGVTYKDEMEKHLRKALKEKEFPSILYGMEKYALENNIVRASGRLTIAGVMRPIEIEAALIPLDSGNGFKINGEFSVNMEEYGVKPPKLMFGALKVKKNVRVSFNIVVEPEK